MITAIVTCTYMYLQVVNGVDHYKPIELEGKVIEVHQSNPNYTHMKSDPMTYAMPMWYVDFGKSLVRKGLKDELNLDVKYVNGNNCVLAKGKL